MSFVAALLSRPPGRPGHQDALDGLRGLAVLIVVLSHLSNVGMFPGAALAGTGKSGVYLFFVLSAWLLTRNLLGWSVARWRSAGAWLDYGVRRVLRIWPLYLVVLLTSWVIVRSGFAAWPYRIDDATLWTHITLREGQSVLWSIPVEFTFYLWLPIVAGALTLLLRARQPGWALAVAGLVTASIVVWCWPPARTATNDVRLGPYLAVFLCGAWAAAVERGMERGVLPQPALGGWALLGGIAAAGVAIATPRLWGAPGADSFDPELNHRWFVYFGMVWAVLLMSVLHGPSWLRAPFTWVPMRLLGVVSFSLYLWHVPVLLWVRNGLGWVGWEGGVATLGLATMVAIASWGLFERPWRDVRVRGGRHLCPGTEP